MATTTETKTHVVELTKFGFKDINGAYVGYSPKLPEKDKAVFVPGQTVEVKMYVADSGKQYVNKVLSVVPQTPKAVKASPTSPKTIPDAPTVDKPIPDAPTVDKSMIREYWNLKDRHISYQGAIQAAYKVAATLAPAPKLKEIAFRIAEEMLEFVHKDDK